VGARTPLQAVRAAAGGNRVVVLQKESTEHYKLPEYPAGEK